MSVRRILSILSALVFALTLMAASTTQATGGHDNNSCSEYHIGNHWYHYFNGHWWDSHSGHCPNDEPTHEPVPGCTDPAALNYNADADEDDQSCEYHHETEEPTVDPTEEPTDHPPASCDDVRIPPEDRDCPTPPIVVVVATEPAPSRECVEVLWLVTVPGYVIETIEVINVAGGWSPDGEVLDVVRNRPGFIVCPYSLPTGDYDLYVNDHLAASFDLFDNVVPQATVFDFPADGDTLYADPLAPVLAFDWFAIGS